jgi:pimeloyl-ACP methyl ester carboxylesterase
MPAHPSDPPPTDPPQVIAGLDVQWSACTLATEAAQAAECATVKLPYRRDVMDGRNVSVFVKRYRPPGLVTQGQLWLLQGGPGAWGKDMDSLGPYLAAVGRPMEVYVIDQRGTGRSSRLGCAAQEALASDGGGAITPGEWPACLAAMQAEWGHGLEGFTVTSTARDLGELIATLRKPEERVFVFGVSYGTYLANRYLQLFPQQATGVILDSICGATCSFTHSDAHFDAVVHQFFDACGQDPTCIAHLGDDPWKTFGDVMTKLDAGSACPAATAAGLTRETLRHAFASLAYSWDQRLLIPAIVHRIDRCGPADAAYLTQLGQALAAPATEEDVTAFSTGLAFHIGLSELWDEPSPPLAALEAEESTQLVCNGVGARMAAVHDVWPRVPRDAYHGAWAKTATPILMLAGSLDPATPLVEQEDARRAFAGLHQTFVTVPRASHGVIANSPVKTPNAVGCGINVLVQFLKDPNASLDTSCTDDVQPLVFEWGD